MLGCQGARVQGYKRLWKRNRMEVDKWLDGRSNAAAIQTKAVKTSNPDPPARKWKNMKKKKIRKKCERIIIDHRPCEPATTTLHATRMQGVKP